jgi:hypothetical protein
MADVAEALALPEPRETRGKLLQVRVTADERSAVHLLAGTHGLTSSALIRDALRHWARARLQQKDDPR